ncbi:peptidoglycan DD-metalloendopeptidase family protein [Microbulbifer thermotolerans]|uniref:peptidoglycan DD-metalloendopeptidase family protein n=1 Tax=Microbulbifer thermotolerans TaxID=252514 RepID=UPI0022488532|nr:peptidoglycan DD-metalloendopeptidase family protein [Microbulbifer thermotolerans]
MECRLLTHYAHRPWRDISLIVIRLASSVLNILIVVLLALLLSSCATPPAPTASLQQPPSIKIQHHIVSRGETLYSIAWRYGKDYRELAAINGIPAPYNIYPGQRLRLTGRPVVKVVSTAPKASKTSQAKVSKTSRTKVSKTSQVAKVTSPVSSTATKRQSSSAKKTKTVAKTTKTNKKSLTPAKSTKATARVSKSSIRWQWPAKGKVISRFRKGDPLRKGVDIAGEKGDSVVAAADGTVIYAGSALRGYGKLLIVKHSNEFLSAYAHNHKLLVKEGGKVKAGQRIAELGSSGTDRNKLHFEIRRNGQPVDPLAYLP